MFCCNVNNRVLALRPKRDKHCCKLNTRVCCAACIWWSHLFCLPWHWRIGPSHWRIGPRQARLQIKKVASFTLSYCGNCGSIFMAQHSSKRVTQLILSKGLRPLLAIVADLRDEFGPYLGLHERPCVEQSFIRRHVGAPK
jgi:ribosomal protein L32